MEERTLVDTGPIVALLVGADAHHPWALSAWQDLESPVFTCEAVLSEAQFIVQRLGGNPLAVLEMVKREAVKLDFCLQEEIVRLVELQRTYRNVPMSLADACLVRMSELTIRSRVFTTDSDFRIYRRNGRQIIPLLQPEIF